jgi:hypothetical protein
MRTIFGFLFCLFSLQTQAKIIEMPNVGALLHELQSELVSMEHTVDPLNKQFSCYHIGKSQTLLALINETSVLRSDLSQKNKKILKNISKKINDFNKYCSNKSSKITLDAMALLFKRRSIEAKVAKLETTLSDLLTLNIIEKRELNLLQKLKDLSLELPTQFGSTFKEEISPEDFKPESCVAIGRIVPIFEIAGLIDASSLNDNDSKTIVENIKNDPNIRFIVEELKSICFDERGFSKYVRDVKNFQSKMQVSENL